MKVAVTGTPGTGKTTAVERVEANLDAMDLNTVDFDAVDLNTVDFDVVHLNDVIREEGLYEGRDEARGSLVADLDAVGEYLEQYESCLVESHLAHHFDADRVVVLRCHPDELRRRLHERDEPDAKIEENAESEALDVVLAETVDRHGMDRVYELDTTDQSPEEVAAEIGSVLADERGPRAGIVDFTDAITFDRKP